MEKKIQGRSVHSDNLFLFTKELMDEQDFKIAELNAVLVSNGPGSYTGLRIAASALKGILFGTDVKLYAVNTLASFAMNTEAEKGDTVHSIIDARRTHLCRLRISRTGINFAMSSFGASSLSLLIQLEKSAAILRASAVLHPSNFFSRRPAPASLKAHPRTVTPIS